VAAALGLGDPGFHSSVEPARFQTLAVARDRDVFQAQVDPHRFLRRRTLFHRQFHRQTQPPIAHRILRETALAPLHIVQTLSLEYPERLATKPQCTAFALQTRGLKRNPTQGATCAATDTPSQPAPLRRRTLLRILHADALNRIRANAFKVL